MPVMFNVVFVICSSSVFLFHSYFHRPGKIRYPRFFSWSGFIYFDTRANRGTGLCSFGFAVFAIFAVVIRSAQIQAQCVRHDAEARQTHRRCPQHRVQRQPQRDENARGDRNTDGIVKERPKQVFVDITQGLTAETDGCRHICQTILHQHKLRRVKCDVRARADCSADIRARQRRRVIDPITDHHDFPVFFKVTDHTFLPVRQYARDDLVHAGLRADGSSRFFVIAGQHDHAQPQIAQIANRSCAVLFDGIRDRDDAQQLAVIRRMVKDLNVDTRIIGCPIIREDDGLAKSSRNTYLNGEERQAALVLNRSLKAGKALVDAGETRACVIKSAITAEIEKEPLAKIDYVDVVDFDTITPVEKLEGSILVAIAVYIGKTRLIDNFIVEK